MYGACVLGQFSTVILGRILIRLYARLFTHIGLCMCIHVHSNVYAYMQVTWMDSNPQYGLLPQKAPVRVPKGQTVGFCVRTNHVSGVAIRMQVPVCIVYICMCVCVYVCVCM